MSANPKRIRVNPDLQPILEESTNSPLILEAGDGVYRINAQRITSGDDWPGERVISADDPLLRFIGIDTSEGDADTSVNIHHYLADAYNHTNS